MTLGELLQVLRTHDGEIVIKFYNDTVDDFVDDILINETGFPYLAKDLLKKFTSGDEEFIKTIEFNDELNLLTSIVINNQILNLDFCRNILKDRNIDEYLKHLEIESIDLRASDLYIYIKNN